MSTGEIVQLVREAAIPPFIALFLYGSYARGDYNQSSDIDILQVTPNHRAPSSVGKINITCYTPAQLMALARNGSLFARHIVLEALTIDDSTGFLQTLKSAYIAPDSYAHLKGEIMGSLPLVAVSQGLFENNTRHYASTASYLLRTYIYAKAVELGAKSFSLREVVGLIGDRRSVEALGELKEHPTYEHFQKVVDLLFELTGTTRRERKESLEAFVVNSYGVCELAVVLGLRILARGDLLTYVFVEPRP